MGLIIYTFHVCLAISTSKFFLWHTEFVCRLVLLIIFQILVYCNCPFESISQNHTKFKIAKNKNTLFHITILLWSTTITSQWITQINQITYLFSLLLFLIIEATFGDSTYNTSIIEFSLIEAMILLRIESKSNTVKNRKFLLSWKSDNEPLATNNSTDHLVPVPSDSDSF